MVVMIIKGLLQCSMHPLHRRMKVVKHMECDMVAESMSVSARISQAASPSLRLRGCMRSLTCNVRRSTISSNMQINLMATFLHHKHDLSRPITPGCMVL
jgi:hypothetical protein